PGRLLWSGFCCCTALRPFPTRRSSDLEGLGALRCRGGAQVLSHRVGDELAHGESECVGTLFDLVGVLDGQARSDQTASSLAGTPGPGSVECHARHESAVSVMRTGGWAACLGAA